MSYIFMREMCYNCCSEIYSQILIFPVCSLIDFYMFPLNSVQLTQVINLFLFVVRFVLILTSEFVM